MNIKFPCVLAVFFGALSMACAQKPDPKFLSAGWLEKGCVAIVVATSDSSQKKDSQQTDIVQVALWLNGYVNGFNGATLTDINNAKSPEKAIFYPPETWIDGRTLAPLILAFLQANRKMIPPTAHAREVMSAFWLLEHPNATAEQKTLGEVILFDISTK